MKIKTQNERHCESQGLEKGPQSVMTIKSSTFELALYSLTDVRISAFCLFASMVPKV